MKRIPAPITDAIREALERAWEEGFRQANVEFVSYYAGPLHVNPYKGN